MEHYRAEPRYARRVARALRPRHALLLAGTAVVLALVVLGLTAWARSDVRDVRCDRGKRAVVQARGEDYSCVLQIPGHDRGH
jgi:hypothetical protein